jgi:hypothetical protein
MAYDPTVPTESERSVAYYIVGIGAAANAVLLSAQLVSLPSWIAYGCVLAVAASLLVAILSSRNDDYFRHISFVASRFAMGVIAIWFCLEAIIHAGNGAQIVGILAGGGQSGGNPAAGPKDWFASETLAVTVAMAFHIRFFFERYRR